MRKQDSRIGRQIILIFISLITISQQLAGEEVAAECHCDLTQSFCDFQCCCDTDCSSTITDACFNYRSAQFCIDSSYYYKINPLPTLTSTGTDGCYYFNISTEIKQEVGMSEWQAKSFAEQIDTPSALSVNTTKMYRGYRGGDVMEIGGVSGFQFVDGSGGCVATGSSGVNSIKVRFGADMDITCLGNSNSINLFSKIVNKKVSKYYQDNNSDSLLTIPSPSSSYTKVALYFMILTHGSQKSKYIQSIQIRSESISSTTRTLSLKFIESGLDYIASAEDPSFFPQIPKDIFYPIHQIVYTF